jgi:hypothetical protein
LTKLQAFPRQNALAAALQDYGRLVKTLFILRYLQRPELRKRVGGQLNKGESLNGLRDTVNFAHHGNVRHRQLADQAGFDVADNDLAHLGPTMTEHINVNGRYYFDLTRTPKPLRPTPEPPTTYRT